MANLLADESLWSKKSATLSDNVWTLAVTGSYSETPNGNINTNAIAEGDTLKATVAYNITAYDSYINDVLYFVVYLDGASNVVHTIYTLGDDLPASGSFDIDIDVSNAWGVSIGAGTSETDDPQFNAAYGYESFGTITLTIPPTGPTAEFSDTVSELTATFVDASTQGTNAITTWAWDFGDGSTSTAQNPTHTYAAGGTYAVSLTVTDSIGLSDTATGSVTVSGPLMCSFNCTCDDPNPSRTLAELRAEMMRRLGFSTLTANPPPGMPELLNSFLQGAQRSLYRQYPVLRTERFYTWDMVAGTRFYDLDANADTCTKQLDPRMISWAGLSEGCDNWRSLVCGIPPECYQNADERGIPYRYEIRQCIEVWPAPDVDTYKLRIKGDFGLEPFEADTDQCTIDDEAVFLFALARAKAHYGQPDANTYQTDATNYIRNLAAGAHQTRRYVPGECVATAMPKPIWVPKEY